VFLKAIRYRLRDLAKTNLFRFDSQSRFQVLCCQANEKEEIRQAIQYALFGKETPLIKEAIVQFVDQDQDSWIVERSEQRRRIVHNNKLINHDEIFHNILASSLGQSEELQLGQFELYIQDGRTFTKELHEDKINYRKIKSMIDKGHEKLRHRLETYRLPMNDIDQYQKWQKACERTYASYMEILRQEKAIELNAKSIGDLQVNDIVQTQAEISLLEEIAITAKPILDPANNPKILSDKLNACKDKIENIRKKYSLEATPFEDTPWAKLIKIYATKEVYGALHQALNKLHQHFQSQIQPIYEDYIQALEEVLKKDIDITTELETCLSSLQLQREQIERSSKSFSKTIANFIKPSAGEIPVQTSELEKARMHIDYVLQKLGELHHELAIESQKHLLATTGFEQKAEQVSKEYEKVEQIWQANAQNFNIPVGIGVKEWVDLLSSYLEFNHLLATEKELKNSLNEQKQRIHRIQDLVLKWRSTSNSQKDTDINSPPLILAEARSLVQLLPKKQQHLSKLKEKEENVRLFNHLRHNIANRKHQLIQKWDNTLKELNIEAFSIDHESLGDCFEAVREWNASQKLLQNCLENESLQQTIQSHAISLLDADAIAASLFALQMEKALAQANWKGIVLFLSASSDHQRVLEKCGASLARSTSPQPNPTPVVARSKEDIVAMLNGRV
jgi:hypothetical protein